MWLINRDYSKINIDTCLFKINQVSRYIFIFKCWNNPLFQFLSKYQLFVRNYFIYLILTFKITRSPFPIAQIRPNYLEEESNPSNNSYFIDFSCIVRFRKLPEAQLPNLIYQFLLNSTLFDLNYHKLNPIQQRYASIILNKRIGFTKSLIGFERLDPSSSPPSQGPIHRYHLKNLPNALSPIANGRFILSTTGQMNKSIRTFFLFLPLLPPYYSFTIGQSDGIGSTYSARSALSI